MKFETTTKELKKGYYKIISVGYCDIQQLMHYENPIAYCAGIYGWSFDVYDVDGIAICTGYRPPKAKNMKNDYKIVKEFEKRASDLSSDSKIDYKKKQVIARKLLIEFVESMEL